MEGHISHTDTVMEGPMDEYPGYVGRGGSLKPVLTVSAVTFRSNPIFPFSVAGAPVDENHTGWGIPHAAEILHLLQAVPRQNAIHLQQWDWFTDSAVLLAVAFG